MADILGQAEVDALLKAVDSGDIDAVAPTSMMGGGDSEANVSVYDFKRPERVGKDQLAALERLHEVFARNVAASLSSQLRSVVECTLEEIEQATFQEFQLASANPTCMSFLTCEPLEGEVILEINPTIVYMMFDKLIGGSASRSTDPGRPMTEIEWRVMDGVLGRIRDQLRAAWEGIDILDFQFSSNETNPMLAQTIPPNEPVVLVTFELTIGGEETGNMVLCLPHNVIEPVLNRMSSFWFSSKVHRSEESTRYIRSKLTSAPIEMVAYLKESTISAAELLRLGIGDVIQLPHKNTDEVALSIDGQVKFYGMPGIFEKRNRKAVRLTRIIEQASDEAEEVVLPEPVHS